jgi:hypothetical protein
MPDLATLVGAAFPVTCLIAAVTLLVLVHRDRRRSAVRTTTTPCRVCRTPKPVRQYLCPTCWAGLSGPARHALIRRDSMALARLRDLYRQIDAGMALADVRVTP